MVESNTFLDMRDSIIRAGHRETNRTNWDISDTRIVEALEDAYNGNATGREIRAYRQINDAMATIVARSDCRTGVYVPFYAYVRACERVNVIYQSASAMVDRALQLHAWLHRTQNGNGKGTHVRRLVDSMEGKTGLVVLAIAIYESRTRERIQRSRS